MVNRIIFLLVSIIMLETTPIMNKAHRVMIAEAGVEVGEGFRLLREAMVKSQISNPPDYRTPVRDKKVLKAMGTVPRHLFVKRRDISRAYGDYPLPIGYGQTISQDRKSVV